MLEVRAIVTGTTGRWWEGRNRDAENRLVGTAGDGGGRTNSEHSVDTFFTACNVGRWEMAV